jgi:hypothetical protein
MLNETHRAPPRYKISAFFSSLLGFRRAMKARALEASVCLGVRGLLTEVGYGIEM